MAIPVLMYHAIHPDRSPITLSPLVFSQQMNWLKTNGYQVISLRRLAEYLRNAEPLPERNIVLTFDDGYQSIYQNTFRVLLQFGFTATVFLVAGFCGGMNDWKGQPAGIPRLPMLNWDQAREMDQAGIDFGAHTINHARLDQLSNDQIRNEILGSRQIIADKLGHEIDSFAYPYGRYDQPVISLVRETFIAGCSTRLGLVTPKSSPHDLERVEVLYLQPAIIFRGMDQPWFPGYLSLRKNVRRVASSIFNRPWK